MLAFPEARNAIIICILVKLIGAIIIYSIGWMSVEKDVVDLGGRNEDQLAA